MPCEFPLRFVSFLALVALEWSRHHVRSHVAFQIARVGRNKVALVTFERSLSCVHHHNMEFQITICDARILTRCASLAFLQSASSCAFAGGLMSLLYIHIDCTGYIWTVFLLYAPASCGISIDQL